MFTNPVMANDSSHSRKTTVTVLDNLCKYMYRKLEMTITVDRNTQIRGSLEIVATASLKFVTVPPWLYSSLAVFKSTSVHKVWHCFPFLGSRFNADIWDLLPDQLLDGMKISLRRNIVYSICDLKSKNGHLRFTF